VVAPLAPVILFDGVCNLCNATVQFVVARDPRARFRFAALQSAPARHLLDHHGMTSADLNTVVLVDGERCYVKSEAALRIVRHLSGAWPLLTVLRLVPRPLRDAVYDWVARNRYDWFGRRRTCMVPAAALRTRFLGAHEPR